MASACLLLLVAVTCLSAYLRHGAGGLGCAPWPACFGQGERVAAGPVVIDGQALTAARTAHRITATLALLLLMALVFTSVGRRPRLRREGALSSALLALALLLALLGVFTPGSRLPAVAIGNLLGGFVMVALAARLVRAPTHRGLGTLAIAVALLLLAQVVTGAFVSASRAGLACTDIRECLDQARAGGWDWAALNPWREPGFAVGTPYAEGALAQLLHRLGGLLVAPAVAGLAMIAMWRGRRREAFVLGALLAVGGGAWAGARQHRPALGFRAVAQPRLGPAAGRDPATGLTQIKPRGRVGFRQSARPRRTRRYALDTRVFNLPRYLSLLPLFSDLSAAELERLAVGCTLQRLSRGDMVFRCGDACEAFHLVVTGQIKLFLLSPAGQEKIIEIIAPGQSFAEALMFADRPYIVNAQALTDATVLSIGKAAVVGEIEREPRFALRMLAGISRRLHGLVHDVEAYALHTGMQRVIGYLLRDQLAEDRVSGEVIIVSLPVSKATIASRLSLTPEYFSRVLHELESAGLIAVDKRDIHILDAKRLATYQPA